MGKLDTKTALVTGSGRGIGCEIALKLASDGARVVVNDLDAEPAKDTVSAIEAADGTAVACVGSVNPDVLAMMKHMISLGRTGTPTEAAGSVYLLCIPESDYVSGQTLVCGGGFMF